MFRQYINVFKLRIGMVITLAALGGVAITPGQPMSVWKILILSLSVMMASAAAGAFNQYCERDIDAKMARTKNRPFVSGFFEHSRKWLVIIGALLLVAVVSAALAFNAMTALNIFLGAFTYAIVYTVWLKRRTWLNIVFGGLAGSFAVLAGAAAVNPSFGPLPGLLALVLFLWTPPHFWALALCVKDQYAKAGIPMLPVVKGDERTRTEIFWYSLIMVPLTLSLVLLGEVSWIYSLVAFALGLLFVQKAWVVKTQKTQKAAYSLFGFSIAYLMILFLVRLKKHGQGKEYLLLI